MIVRDVFFECVKSVVFRVTVRPTSIADAGARTDRFAGKRLSRGILHAARAISRTQRKIPRIDPCIHACIHVYMHIHICIYVYTYTHIYARLIVVQCICMRVDRGGRRVTRETTDTHIEATIGSGVGLCKTMSFRVSSRDAPSYHIAGQQRVSPLSAATETGHAF